LDYHHEMISFLRTVACTSVLALLTGCAPQLTAPPTGGKTYASVKDLYNDYLLAGGHCPDFVEDDDAAKYASTSGTCRYPEDEYSWISGLMVFPDTASRDLMLDWWERQATDGRTESWTALVGPNWIINESSDVRNSLGGEWRSFNE
jgi:hypothetical protein